MHFLTAKWYRTILFGMIVLPQMMNAAEINGNKKANSLTGTETFDTIKGRGGNDTIKGWGGNDIIKGGKGDDLLWGDAGNDILYGGKGKDTAFMSGKKSDYRIRRDNKFLVLTDKRYGSPDGEDRMKKDIEWVSFRDGKVPYSILALIGTGQTPEERRAEVVRFLNQTTFGATEESITEVLELGNEEWLDKQISMASAYDRSDDTWKTHLERTIELAKQYYPEKYPESLEAYLNPDNGIVFNHENTSGDIGNFQMAAWLENALKGKDQLRQRMAYALSQILVVSDSETVLKQRGESLAAYYDLLAKHALGNYEELLYAIATSPAMGMYLTHQGNKKADVQRGTRPDENFAREVMQLFTIGLYKLQNNGEPYQDGKGNLIPSYTQDDIEELSRSMTGWDLAWNRYYGDASKRWGDYTQSMEFTAEYHDSESKMVMDQNIPAGLNGPDEMAYIVSLLFHHENTPMFVSKLLIKRFTTANPSPAYIERISTVFRNNGKGVRGDLAAVIKAILLDAEARSHHGDTDTFAKPKEPIVALMQLLRAFHADSLDGWVYNDGRPFYNVYYLKNLKETLGQAPLRSETVFNFYSPDYIPSDSYFVANQLSSPEFQIQGDQVIIGYSNYIYDLLNNYEKTWLLKRYGSLQAFISARHIDTLRDSQKIILDFSKELEIIEMAMENDSNGDFLGMDSAETGQDDLTPKARGAKALVDALDIKLTGGTLTEEQKLVIVDYLVNGQDNNDNVMEALMMVRDAVRAITTTSTYMVTQ